MLLIQFDRFFVVLGIFHNQVPAVITFAPTPVAEDIFAQSHFLTTTPPALDEENVVWEEADLDSNSDFDFDFVSTSTITPSTSVPTITTTYPIWSTALPLATTATVAAGNDDFELIDPSSSVPIEHFDLIDDILSSSTISGGVAVAQDDSELNWWDLNEIFTQSLSENVPISSSTRTTNIKPIHSNTMMIYNSTTIPSVTRFEHLSVHIDDDDDEGNTDESVLPLEAEIDMNDYFFVSSTPNENLSNKNQTFVPYYFNDYKPKNEQKEFLNLIKPLSTLAMPPFSWMLQQANQTQQTASPRKITRTITTTMTTPMKLKHRKISNDVCQGKRCQHGGRLSGDCLCICLPAFTGDVCQTGK